MPGDLKGLKSMIVDEGRTEAPHQSGKNCVVYTLQQNDQTKANKVLLEQREKNSQADHVRLLTHTLHEVTRVQPDAVRSPGAP